MQKTKAKRSKQNRQKMAARATPRVTARPKRPRATSWVRKATDHKSKAKQSKAEKLTKVNQGRQGRH